MASGSSSTDSTPSTSYENLVFKGPISVKRSNACLTDGFDLSFLFLLLGPTGTGKSSFIEALAGEGSNLQISKNQLNGFTHEIICYRLENVEWKCSDTDHRHTVYIVDTPGFADNAFSELRMFNMLMDWLKQGPAFTEIKFPVMKRTIINHILYFHPITAPRVPGSKHGLLKMLTDLTGGDVPGGRGAEKRISFVTTMWNMMRDTDKANMRHNQLQSLNGPCGSFIGHGSKVLKFENTQESALNILDSCPAPIEHFFRFERMLIKDQHIRDTPFGRPLYTLLCDRIQQLATEKASASKILETQNDDPMALEYLAEHILEVDAQLDALQQEADEFGPSPAASFVSFSHLFGNDSDVPISPPYPPQTSAPQAKLHASSPLMNSIQIDRSSIARPSLMKLQARALLDLMLRFPRKIRKLLHRDRI